MSDVLRSIHKAGFEVMIVWIWVPSHCGTISNEHADRLAEGSLRGENVAAFRTEIADVLSITDSIV